jgi:spore coat polysaccharide biosynthesis protein SpsF
MLKNLGIVEVPCQEAHATASGNMLATRRFAGHYLLEWVARRTTDALLLDHVAVIVSGEDQARCLSDALPADVSVHIADAAADPVARLADAVRAYQPQAIVRVDVDHPFVDPVLIDRLVTKAESHRFCDYLGYCSTRGGRVLLAQLGVLAEWCRADAVLLADQLATEPRERQHLTRFIYSRPDVFQLRLIPIPKPLDRDDVRLSLAVAEDWEHAQMILDALGLDELDWQRIAELLDEQPEMRRRMAALNRGEPVS